MVRAALVTGGAKRIGRAIVQRLAAEGVAVAIHCLRSQEAARTLAAEIEEAGGRAAVLVADLEDEADVDRLVAEAASAIGPLDLLINSASVFEPDEIGSLTREGWRRHQAINLEAPICLVRDFARQLPEGADGLVVNLVDQRVLKPVPDFFSYGASKAALHGATRTLAQALAPRIRVNAIGPGPTLPSPRQSAKDFSRLVETLPLRRGPSPAEIAEAVMYFAGAPSVTGQMLVLDGGQHLAWQTPDLAISE